MRNFRRHCFSGFSYSEKVIFCSISFQFLGHQSPLSEGEKVGIQSCALPNQVLNTVYN